MTQGKRPVAPTSSLSQSRGPTSEAIDPATVAPTFAAFLEERLSELGLDASGLMKEAGISLPQYYHWKASKRAVSRASANAIAWALAKFYDAYREQVPAWADSFPLFGRATINEMSALVLSKAGHAPSTGVAIDLNWDRIDNKNLWRLGWVSCEPWAFKEKDSSGRVVHSGIAIDVADLVSRLLGLQYEWCELKEWDQITSAILERRIDAFVPLLLPIPARFRKFALAGSLGHGCYPWAVGAGLTKGADRVEDLSKLQAYCLYYIRGEVSEMADGLLPHGPNYPRQEVNSVTEVLEALLAHKEGDVPRVFVAEATTCFAFENQHKSKLQNLTVPELSNVFFEPSWGLHPDEPTLRRTIEESMKLLYSYIEQRIRHYHTDRKYKGLQNFFHKPGPHCNPSTRKG